MRRSAHWRAIAPVPVSAGSGQEPCPGVWWISSRAASSGGNVPYGGPAVWTSGPDVTGTARPSAGDRDRTPAGQRRARHQGGRHAVPPAPEAVNGGVAGPRRPGRPCLPPPPPRRHVHADRHPVLREIPPAPLRHVLHRGDGIAVRLRRNAPAPLRPRPDAVFSGVFLTVPSGMEPAVSGPPGRAASGRIVQWLRPSGGRARAMATGPASPRRRGRAASRSPGGGAPARRPARRSPGPARGRNPRGPRRPVPRRPAAGSARAFACPPPPRCPPAPAVPPSSPPKGGSDGSRAPRRGSPFPVPLPAPFRWADRGGLAPRSNGPPVA